MELDLDNQQLQNTMNKSVRALGLFFNKKQSKDIYESMLL